MIRDFFVSERETMQTFGPVHMVCIILFILAFTLIVINKDKIFNLSEKTKRKVALYLITILFINMAIYYLAKVYYGVYDYKDNLPLHFCFISGYLFMYGWLTKNIKIIKFTYFCAFLGPTVAIIWPSSPGLESYTFYQFVISHHIFLLGNLFLYYAYRYKLTKNDMLKTFIKINLIFLVMSIFNSIFNTNYIMSKSLPVHFMNMYPFFKTHNYPIVWLELSGIIIIFLAYIPVYFLNKNKTAKIVNSL